MYQYLSINNSSSSAIRFLQTVSLSICRQQLQLRYTLFIKCINIYLLTTAPASLYAVCRLYVSTCWQQLQLLNTLLQTVSVHICRQQLQLRYTCMQSVSVSICRQQLQLRYTLYVDCISIYQSSTASAPLHAVYRLYQYLSVVNSSSSAIRCMQTVSVSSTVTAPLYAVCRLYQDLSVVNSSSSSIHCLQTVSVSICRQQLLLSYTLYVDCFSIYLLPTAPASLYAVCRLYQYLSAINSLSSSKRCSQTVSLSICRQQLQLLYTLFIDYISFYLSSTAPGPLYAVYRLYQYLSVVNSSSSAIRCMWTVSVSICRQQLQLLYTLVIDYISIYLSSTAPSPLHALCRLDQYRQQLQLLYTLYVDCISIYLLSKDLAPLYAVCRLSVSTCRQQLQLPCTLVIDCISIYLSSTAPAPLYAVYRLSVSICPQQLQLLYTLFIDCISIYLSSTAPAPLHAVYRRYQYLFVVNNSSSAIRCLYVSVSICRQQLQLRYTLYVD